MAATMPAGDGPDELRPEGADFEIEARAEAWTRRQPFVAAPVTPHLLSALAPSPGERIVDIGTGAGPIALAAAEEVGERGGVLAVDISPYLVEYVNRLARSRGLANLRAIRRDAAREEFPGGPFDAATSQMGLMFFPEPVAALSNIRRQLLAGARLVFACWTGPEENPLHPTVLRSLVSDAIREANQPGKPGPFAFVDVFRTRSILEEAGFARLSRRRIEVRVTVPFESVFDEQLLDGLPGSPSRERLAGDLRSVREYVDAYRVPGGIRAPLGFQIYSAINPG